MNKSLLVALALLPVVAIGGEQVILEKDFGGKAMRKVKHVDGWSLASYCPGELSREQGTLKLKAIPARIRLGCQASFAGNGKIKDYGALSRVGFLPQRMPVSPFPLLLS